MTPQTAISSISQGEKIKSGIIWATEIVNAISGYTPHEKTGAEKALTTLIRMIGFEAVLSRRTTKDASWIDVEKDIDMALVMLNSKVAHEAAFHLSKALQKTTSITQKSIKYLAGNGIL